MITILNQVAELRALPVSELKTRWAELFGTSPAQYNRRALEDRLAYRIQELTLGGLKPATIKRLDALGDSMDGGNKKLRSVRADVIPIPGTLLVREWKGIEHTVTVTHDGFDYQGQPYKSLSPIAKRITGTSWSGFVFFGLKSPGASK